MTGLLTDLYQLTMAAGYFEAGKTSETATFELFFRRLPRYRNYVVAAGLAQAVDYLLNLKFTDEEIDYLRGLPQFRRVSDGFFDALRQLRFTGDLFAMPEGTPIFANEPFLTVRAPLMEAQIVETYLLATIGFQSLIATKASRIVEVAGGRAVVDFGARRAHSAEAGVLAGTCVLYRRMHRHQQHRNRVPLWHSCLWNGRAFLGAVLRLGNRGIPGAPEIAGRRYGVFDRHLRHH